MSASNTEKLPAESTQTDFDDQPKKRRFKLLVLSCLALICAVIFYSIINMIILDMRKKSGQAIQRNLFSSIFTAFAAYNTDNNFYPGLQSRPTAKLQSDDPTLPARALLYPLSLGGYEFAPLPVIDASYVCVVPTDQKDLSSSNLRRLSKSELQKLKSPQAKVVKAELQRMLDDSEALAFYAGYPPQLMHCRAKVVPYGQSTSKNQIAITFWFAGPDGVNDFAKAGSDDISATFFADLPMSWTKSKTAASIKTENR